MQIEIGDKVEKVDGYKWPGVVVAKFHTLEGRERVVVECTTLGVEGALHIYNPLQLRVTERRSDHAHQG